MESSALAIELVPPVAAPAVPVTTAAAAAATAAAAAAPSKSNAPATVSGLSCSNNADAWIGATAAYPFPLPSKCATASDGCSSCTRPGGVFGGFGRRLLPRLYLGWSSLEVSPLLPVGGGMGSSLVHDGDTPSRSLGSPRCRALVGMLPLPINGAHAQ